MTEKPTDLAALPALWRLAAEQHRRDRDVAEKAGYEHAADELTGRMMCFESCAEDLTAALSAQGAALNATEFLKRAADPAHCHGDVRAYTYSEVLGLLEAFAAQGAPPEPCGDRWKNLRCDLPKGHIGLHQMSGILKIWKGSVPTGETR